jgi:hypothetical protein
MKNAHEKKLTNVNQLKFENFIMGTQRMYR